jgi:hypothetical protein
MTNVNCQNHSQRSFPYSQNLSCQCRREAAIEAREAERQAALAWMEQHIPTIWHADAIDYCHGDLTISRLKDFLVSIE